MSSQTKLAERAEHTVAFNAAQLAFFNVLTAVNIGIVHCNGNNVAGFEVLCAGNNLNVLVFADVYRTNPHMVGIWVTGKRVDSSRDNIFKLFSLNLKSFNL